jgi:hypothetical protein
MGSRIARELHTLSTTLLSVAPDRTAAPRARVLELVILQRRAAALNSGTREATDDFDNGLHANPLSALPRRSFSEGASVNLVE